MNIKKILIIEDSELLHRMYDLILMRYRKEGAKILHAYNGKEGVEILQDENEVGLMILDINMPVMNGIEFLHYRISEDSVKKIPVIIISTEGSETDLITGLKLGATGYLSKPYKPDELHALIDKIDLKGTNLTLSERVGGNNELLKRYFNKTQSAST